MGMNSNEIDRTGGGSFSLRDFRQEIADRLKKSLQFLWERPSTQSEDHEVGLVHPQEDNADAVFLGWQRTFSGKAFALYTVLVKGHRLYRSTVSERTLQREHLATPPTPDLDEELKGMNHEE